MGLSDIIAAILRMFRGAPAPLDGTNGHGYQPVQTQPLPMPPVPVMPSTSTPPAPSGTSPAPDVPANVPAPAFALTTAMLAAAVGITAARAAPWVDPLTDGMTRYSIDTPTRAAAFIAQVAHESVRFQFTRELWGPTAEQLTYEPPGAAAKDLGNTQKGDGQRFCGRGLIQITGRANYAACGAALGLDLITDPELLEQPACAATSAGWFWSARGLNVYADSGDFVTLTKRINGGTNGLADRQALWASCKSAMGITK